MITGIARFELPYESSLRFLSALAFHDPPSLTQISGASGASQGYDSRGLTPSGLGCTVTPYCSFPNFL